MHNTEHVKTNQFVDPKLRRLLASKQEAAEVLGVSIRTVENLVARKELQSRKIGRRRLIPIRALEMFVRSDHGTSINRDDPVVVAGQPNADIEDRRRLS